MMTRLNYTTDRPQRETVMADLSHGLSRSTSADREFGRQRGQVLTMLIAKFGVTWMARGRRPVSSVATDQCCEDRDADVGDRRSSFDL